jgi:class 3 adenylate cyclase
MFTDLQGYTSLMQESEARAFQVRKKHREIFDASTEKFDGEMINYYGEGTLSIFASAIKAVHCAIEMQKKFLMDPRFQCGSASPGGYYYI